jgi:hypothetical protein
VSSRLATVFSLLKEFPSIRYMAPKPAASSQTAADRARSGCVPQPSAASRLTPRTSRTSGEAVQPLLRDHRRR